MKFYTYAVILVGIVMILNLAGISTPVGGGIAKALNIIDDDANIGITDFKDSELYNDLVLILGGLIGTGLVLGAFGRAPDVRYITAALILTITGLLAADIIAIYQVVATFSGWMKYGLGLIIGGLTVGLFITALEFWQGTD